MPSSPVGEHQLPSAHQPTIQLACILLSRTWLVFAFAAASRQQGAELLSLFYPERFWFYFGLTVGLIPASRLLIPGLWNKLTESWQAAIMLLLLLADLAHQISALQQNHWTFHWSQALLLWLSGMLGFWLIKAVLQKDSAHGS